MLFARGHGRGRRDSSRCAISLPPIVEEPDAYGGLRSRRVVAAFQIECGKRAISTAAVLCAGQVSILREGTETSLKSGCVQCPCHAHTLVARAPAADTRLPLSGGSRILFPGNLQKGSDLLNGRFCSDAVFLTQYRDRTVFDELVRPTDSNNWCGNSSIR